jgi:hypothetical protein
MVLPVDFIKFIDDSIRKDKKLFIKSKSSFVIPRVATKLRLIEVKSFIEFCQNESNNTYSK